jgi:hypothetical protein
MQDIVKIGNSQGFWGDRPQATFELLTAEPDLNYITLDYLAEVSLSIMAIQAQKNKELGFAGDFLDVVKSLIPLWSRNSTCKIITNAGGLNPVGCAKAVNAIIKQAGLSLKVGIVYGDNVLDMILNDVNSKEFNNLDTEESINIVSDKLVTANAYLGAKGIVEALKKGADIVITGRVADPSLVVAAAVHYFNWNFDDYDKIASATIAGHLIECGSQVTGGMSTDWLAIEDPVNIGFPIVEMFKDGTFVITKPKNASGWVNEQTVKEQLLYEISDPKAYLSPDATVSFLGLKLDKLEKDRILISGGTGTSPPESLKVSATYKDGFKAEGMLVMFGPCAVKKAKHVGDVIFSRVKSQGYMLNKTHMECLGNLSVVPGIFEEPKNLMECVLRVAVSDSNYKAVECFTKQIAPLITSGPQGLTGYISGRPKIREVFGYWPCLIAANKVKPIAEVLI